VRARTNGEKGGQTALSGRDLRDRDSTGFGGDTRKGEKSGPPALTGRHSIGGAMVMKKGEEARIDWD
jgi:hypothetical protein